MSSNPESVHDEEDAAADTMRGPHVSRSDSGIPQGDSFDALFERHRLQSRLFLGVREDLRLANFILRARLAVGGMGTVYHAWDEELGRDVALKFVSDAIPDAYAQSMREARVLSRVNHPNIVQIHQIIHGTPDLPVRAILVLEYVEGPTLAAWSRMEKRAWTEVVSVAGQIARALISMHQQDLMHNDVTPGNVIIGALGLVKLIDFGLVSEGQKLPWRREALEFEGSYVTRAGAGTKGYASPEVFLGDRRRVDVRSDLFGLCATTWSALTGRTPYGPEELYESPATARLHVEDWPREAPAWLRELLASGLAVDPSARPINVGAFLAALETRLRSRPLWARILVPGTPFAPALAAPTAAAGLVSADAIAVMELRAFSAPTIAVRLCAYAALLVWPSFYLYTRLSGGEEIGLGLATVFVLLILARAMPR